MSIQCEDTKLYKMIRPPTIKIFLRIPKIFKFKAIFKDRFTSTYNYWL